MVTRMEFIVPVREFTTFCLELFQLVRFKSLIKFLTSSVSFFERKLLYEKN